MAYDSQAKASMEDSKKKGDSDGVRSKTKKEKKPKAEPAPEADSADEKKKGWFRGFGRSAPTG
jgi:hypothetical protein